jgi:condensin complex subunit 2
MYSFYLNTANINLNKLDSAFDIDPLFHKMSKTFDEGGAKGLLLANLGVGSEGCNVVFDSSCEEINNTEGVATKTSSAINENDENDTDMDTETDVAPPRQQEGMIDVSTLKTKLFSLLAGQSVHSLQLVPQLSGLRTEHAALDAAGFIDQVQVGQVSGTGAGASRRGRYAADQQQEKEADHSIHQQAMERSRASIGGRSCLSQSQPSGTDVMGDDEYANDNDFGGGGDYDDGDDDDDDGFDAFMATDENGARFSSVGFNNSFTNDGDGDVNGDGREHGATAVLLDAIADGNVIHGATDYQYFDAAAFASVVSAGTGAADNVWAGALHWKRGARRRPQANANGKKTAEATKRSRSKKSAKQRVFVDFSAAPDNMSDILRQPPARKANGDPLQISKTTLAKHAKADNLLPLDAGMGVEKLSSLFLRPNTILKGPSASLSQSQTNASSNGKTVGFNMAVETWDNGPDDSFCGGDDDGGDGFCFADNGDEDNANGDDFFVHQLHDVRKVDKVHVGHATVAKKVDVKRLKRDLWLELESCFAVSAEKKEGDEEVVDSDADEKEVPEDPASPLPDNEQDTPHCLSFNDAVRDLEAAKSQADVSLPFYFICVLHLANEKGLRLDSKGLEDFHIYKDNATATQLF